MCCRGPRVNYELCLQVFCCFVGGVGWEEVRVGWSQLSQDLISASAEQIRRSARGPELLRLLCPPSFITPFTVNELCSSTPPSFSLSFVLFLRFCVFFFLSSEGLNFDARPRARSPLYIPLCVLSSSPCLPLFLLHAPPPLSPVIRLTPSKSQQSALGEREGKKTGFQAVFDQDDCSFISPSAT